VALGYSFPYVVALLSKMVEVRTAFGTQTLVQTLPVRQARLLAVDTRAAPGTGALYVAGAQQVWRLVPVPVLEQVDQLVREGSYEEALTLCENVPVQDEALKRAKLRSIRVLHSYHLFSQGQFEHAMDLFLELDLDPLQVIGLYPNLLPRDLRARYTYPVPVPELTGSALDKALVALMNYLTQIRPTCGPSNPQLRNDEDYGATQDLPTIVDTSLLKAYIKTNEQYLIQLVTLPTNQCHVRECEKVLANFQRFYELVLLYKTKGLHRPALELLLKYEPFLSLSLFCIYRSFYLARTF
jgi:hypothetical protein